MTNRDQLIANENRLMALGNDEMERQEQEEKEDVEYYEHHCWVWHTCDENGDCRCLICGRRWRVLY